MELAKSMMIILLTGILTDNFVLSKFLGICPFLGVSKTTSGSLGMGCAVTAVMVIATAVTWPLYYFFLVPMGLSYLNTILFIMIIAVLVQLIEMVLKKYIPALYKTLGVYLPLITTNCAVLGVAILNVNTYGVATGLSLLQFFLNGVFSGVGFTVAILLLAGIREKIEYADIPKPFKGFPITLITACIMSMAFVAFSGMAG